MDRTDKPSVAQLPGPRLPADHGLSSLGLVMQLGGTVYLILMAFMALMPVILTAYAPRGAGGSEMWRMFLVFSLGAVRSGFHRSAGTALLYGSPAGPWAAVRNYIIIGLVHAALLPLLLKGILPVKTALPFVFMAAAWPIALAVVFSLQRFRRYREEVPATEDFGFEGASVLMVLFGVIGTLAMGLVLLLMYRAPGNLFDSLEGVLMICMVLMLLVRAVLHALAGKQGIQGASLEEATKSASAYFSFGITSSFVVGGSFLLMFLVNKGPFLMMLLFICAIVALLLAWPLILRRFYAERNFAMLLGGEDAPSYHRSPDAGLTALGWLLLAFAVMDLSSSLAGLLFDTDASAAGQFGLFSAGTLAQAFGKSLWWSVLIGGLQLWAAIELITMSDRFKIATIAYGASAGVIRVAVIMWPMFEDLGRLSRGFGSGITTFGNNMMWGMIALALVIPIGAILLVLRKQTPQATARIRPAADAS